MPTNYVDGGPQIQNDQTWTPSGQFKIGCSYSAAEIVARIYNVNSAGTAVPEGTLPAATLHVVRRADHHLQLGTPKGYQSPLA